MAYVYTHTREDKNEVFYVGIGINSNTFERAYRKHGTAFWERIAKKTSYKIDIILSNVSWEEACAKEIELIKFYGRRDLGTGSLVNMTDGGEGTIGRLKSEEEIAKISGEKNGSHGKIWITKNTQNMFIKKDMLEDYILHGWKKGRYTSEEVKAKISQKAKGRKLSEERKIQISKQMKGHIKTDQERQRRSASLKKREPWNKGVPGFKKLTKEEKLELKIARLHLKTFKTD